MSRPEVPIDYLAVELLTLPASGFTLGADRLGTGILADARQWHDVACNLINAHFRRGGKDSPASSATEAGYLSMTSRNDLNPLENIRIHPGVPVRVRDKRLPEATGTLFTGALDDVSVRFDKGSGDYWVTLSASDLVRNLRRIGIRGDLGTVDAYQSGPGSDRIAELLDRSGVPRSINHRVGIFRSTGVPSIGPSDWVRFGPTPGGVTQRPLAVSEQALWVADLPSGTGREYETTARERGITTQLSGLTPGTIYRVTTAIWQGTQLMATDDDQSRYVLWTDSGAESHSTATSVNGVAQRVRLEVIFRATRNVHQISIARDYTGKLASETGQRIFEAFHVSSTSVHRWDLNGGRPVQSVAYDSTLFNHVTLAADSAKYRWHVNPFGVVRVAPSDTPGIPRLHFTDRKYEEHPVVPLVPYTDITEAYNTAGTINTLEVDNKGRTPSTEVRGGWVTSDTETTFGDEWSRDRFDEREASMALQLPEALVAERVKEIFDKHAEPTYSIQSVTYLAKHHPNFAALDMPAVNIERNGVTATYQVVGIEHEITPDLHRITYRVERA